MSSPEIIQVREVVSGGLCVSVDDGQRVHDEIAKMLRKKQAVFVSFSEIDTLISAFLNSAIGQLYGEFEEETIKEFLEVRDMRNEDLALLKRVVENAKVYFKNKEKYDTTWNNEVGDEE